MSETGVFTPRVRVVGGRYGLSSKEFTPAMVKGVFDELKKPEPNHFSIGITDDVTFTSIPFEPEFSTEPDDQVRAVFWGLGADGTVSANKTRSRSSARKLRITRRATLFTIQKSRRDDGFSPAFWSSSDQKHPHSTGQLHRRAPVFVLQSVRRARGGSRSATLLINSPYDETELWDHLPYTVQK